MNKFKAGQQIIVPNFLINSERYDAGGFVERYVFSENKWRVEVKINSVLILLDESKVVDYNEWHKDKKE